MYRSKALIIEVNVKALGCPGMPISRQLDTLLINAPQALSTLELFRALNQCGFAPRWEDEACRLIWLRDPNVGLALLRCEQVAVTLH